MSRASIIRALITASALLAGPIAVLGQEPARIEFHYSPSENLERIDTALIGSAKTSMDMAAFVLTDRPVIEAITEAARRGVKVRIYLVPGISIK